MPTNGSSLSSQLAVSPCKQLHILGFEMVTLRADHLQPKCLHQGKRLVQKKQEGAVVLAYGFPLGDWFGAWLKKARLTGKGRSVKKNRRGGLSMRWVDSILKKP